jgi:nucleotide-binding universal stress UspA family protein
MTLEIKILIAVDGSKGSMDAVQYAGRFHDPQKTKITLIHILTELPETMEDLKTLASETPAAETGRWQAQMKAGIEKRMTEAEGILVDAGYPKNAVQFKIQTREKGVVKDIIEESKKGYDVLFLGRRGLNDPNDILVGATAYRVLSEAHHLPVAVVGDQPDSNHVLIGFDGSDNAFKGVDCACKLMPHPGRRVVLCHAFQALFAKDSDVLSSGQDKALIDKGRHRVKDLMAEAEKRLTDAGFEAEKVTSKMVESRVSRAVSISRTAEDSGCGTIIIGRRGLTLVKDFMMGRVTMKVLHRAHKMAVWIV